MDSSTLRRAAVFHAVGLAGGITAAGERIGKSPPAVHADLRRFEREVGVALTERAGRSLRLTTKGRQMFEAVGHALAEIDRVRSAIHGDGAELSPLRLGSVTGFGRYRLMPALLPRLPVAQRLMLRTDSHDALLAALGRGEIDLALTYRPVVAAPIESVAVAEEDLSLAGTATLETALAGAVPFVTYAEYEYVFGRWFAEAGGGQPASLIRHDHYEELEEALAAVAMGRGCTIAPADACRHLGVETNGPRCRNILYLCGSRSAMRMPEAELIRACLADAPA